MSLHQAMTLDVPGFVADLRALADAISEVYGSDLHPMVKTARIMDMINNV